ncbi:hypothetical protein HID58_088783 [Brassica napus]|uniref:Uncharacterized protein n=1 Tax=Brassica napus TaxID=3708 RepID=A0ABQ7XX49_BRANA|nr:hypothetical protein HID58_088783 [Brassica napus]
MGGGGGMEELTEDEERALRAQRKQIRSTCFSSFLLSLSAAQTNKAAALAKFLERKLQDPNGLSSIDPPLLRVSGTSISGRRIQHVASFEDVEVSSDDDKIENTKLSKKKKKKKIKEEKKKKKNKKHKVISLAPFQQITVDEDAKLTRPNKKLKL